MCFSRTFHLGLLYHQCFGIYGINEEFHIILEGEVREGEEGKEGEEREGGKEVKEKVGDNKGGREGGRKRDRKE